MSIFSNLFTQLFLHTLCHTEQAYVTRFQQIFKNTVFPSTIIDWNKLDWNIKNSEILRLLKKELYHSLGHLLIAHSIAITLKG